MLTQTELEILHYHHQKCTLCPSFLQQKELLYLMLLILEQVITNTVSGGFMALHKLKEAEA